MIKKSLFLLIVIAGFFLAPYWSGHTGYLLIQVAGYQIETSLVVTVFIFLITWGFILFLRAGVLKILASRRWTKNRLRNYRKNKAVRGLRASLYAWFNRDYEQSATLADKSKAHHPDPQLAYTLAAAAYGESGHLKEQARILVEAKLAGLHDDSLELLRLLNTTDPDEVATLAENMSLKSKRSPAVWRAIAEQLFKFELWEQLRTMLPIIEKQKALSDARLLKFKRFCYQDLFRHEISLDGLNKAWLALPRSARKNHAIRLAYIEVLIMKHHYEEASQITEQGLKRYGLKIKDILQLAPEAWATSPSLYQWIAQQVKEHPDHADVLFLYAATRFMAKEYELAEKALREGLALKPDVYGYLLLGETLYAANKTESALIAFRKASGRRV